MKSIVKLMLVGIAAATATMSLRAQTWEQNLNVALLAQVQASTGGVKKVALNSKALIALLSNINNQVTNTWDTYLTNSPATPEPLPGYPFPPSVVVSDNYVVQGSDGQSYTNNVDFTNNVTFTQTSTSPITYVFNNAVNVGNGVTGHYVADFPADLVTAELVDSNGPAYHLIGSTITPQVTPSFSSTAKLLLIQNLNTGAQTFVVRDGNKGAVVDTDVTPFFGLYSYQQVTQGKAAGSGTTYSHIDFSFNNGRGDSFDSQGEATETDAGLKSKGTDYGTVSKSFSAAVGGSGTAANAPLGSGVMVLGGKISASGGKFVLGTTAP